MRVYLRGKAKKHYFYRKIIVFYLFWAALSISWLSADVRQTKEPVPTRWMSPDGLPKPGHLVPVFAGPLIMVPVEGFLPKSQNTNLPLPGSQKRICLVVENSLYPAIQTKLKRFVQDLQHDGYGVIPYRFISGKPKDLRAFLHNLYAESSSLFGVILIGDIPYIIYEMMEDWGSGGNSPEYEDFPCDLFYMDLDGTWADLREEGEVHAGNGKYDTRSGDIDLEIWVSRMQTSNLTFLGKEAAILNNYFDKNYNYRHGKLRTLSSALVYDDDDWKDMGPEDKSYLRKMLSSVTLVNSPEATNADDYKTKRMPTNQEFIFTRSHGYPGGHGYYQSNKNIFDWIYTNDYATIDPPALFYSFYVCSGCDYSYDGDYLGGTAAFNQKSGLLVWGSTKTGGIWADETFYSSLSEGCSFGAAFVNWYNYVQSLYPSLTPQWWYGMVLIGDGSLHPAVSISGYVKNSSGVGIKGATLNFSNNGGKVITNSKGFYSQSILCGWSGKATPQKTGYTFSPAYKKYTQLGSSKTGQNYKGIKK
jgi:hypothetical protein